MTGAQHDGYRRRRLAQRLAGVSAAFALLAGAVPAIAGPVPQPEPAWAREACANWQEHLQFTSTQMRVSGSLPETYLAAVDDAIAALGAQCTIGSATETSKRFVLLLDFLMNGEVEP